MADRPSTVLVVAGTYRDAQRWAREKGLRVLEWRPVLSSQDLRGYWNATYAIAHGAGHAKGEVLNVLYCREVTGALREVTDTDIAEIIASRTTKETP